MPPTISSSATLPIQSWKASTGPTRSTAYWTRGHAASRWHDAAPLPRGRPAWPLPSLCCRSANGIDGWKIDTEPTLMPDPIRYPERAVGIEDPRITYVPELQQYAVAYTSYSKGGPGVSLALTKDSPTFERYGVIMSPTIKMRPYCPIGWTAMGTHHRPMTPLGAHVGFLLSRSSASGGHRVMMEAAKARGGTQIDRPVFASH